MSFPRLERYLDGLPEGLASYPSYKAKATIIRALSEEMAMPASKLSGAPEPLVQMMVEPPPATSWISEAALVAAHFVYIDAAKLPTSMMLDRVYNTSKRMIDSPMYRILAKVASPKILLRGAEMSWRLLHRGVTIKITFDEKSALVTATHPPNLWTSLVHEGVGVGYRAVIESAGGQNVRCTVRASEPEQGIFLLTWE